MSAHCLVHLFAQLYYTTTSTTTTATTMRRKKKNEKERKEFKKSFFFLSLWLDVAHSGASSGGCLVVWLVVLVSFCFKDVHSNTLTLKTKCCCCSCSCSCYCWSWKCLNFFFICCCCCCCCCFSYSIFNKIRTEFRKLTVKHIKKKTKSYHVNSFYIHEYYYYVVVHT